ncbi:MAG: arginine--tRNA ligase, partial [Chloroflexi bacterium]|nr:arginine--tRNA ligase [Chloroflexota bacterium]
DSEPDTLDDTARAWSLKLEQNDPTARELWQWSVDMTKAANQVNYDRLGVSFDLQHGESFYADMLPSVIGKVEESGLGEREEGSALVVKELPDKNGKALPTFLVQRSDGATLYLTRDIATVIYREQEYHPKKLIYVVGQPQELHFRQVFALTRALGYAQDIELVHISFGTIFSADGNALSTKRGNMIYLQVLLDDAQSRVKALIEEKIAEGKTDLTPEQVDEVAEQVGVGAVIYNDLYQDSKRNITIDWERMLAFEGNSAPYLQYTHARCCSILREAGALPAEFDATQLQNEQELAVIKQIARFPAVVRRAGESYTPYVIAEWLYATAREFARFYRDHSVLKAETPALRAARLQLVAATAQSLRNGLALLAIKAPERM